MNRLAVVILTATAQLGIAGGLEILAEPPAGKFYHGVFPGGKDGMGADITPGEVKAYQRAVGKRPTWVYFWNNWFESRSFPYQTASWIRDSGSVPYVRLMLLSSREIPTPDPVYTLANIIGGQFDADFRHWMQDARRFGSPLLAEFGTEVNGWWFPWSGLWNKVGGSNSESAGEFRAAYRHIIRIAREEGAQNVRWVFHVCPWDEPLAEWNRLENYYPGDEWIDWVGLSVYGRQVPRDKHAIPFRTQMDPAYARLTKLTDKPVIVCEFGAIRDDLQRDWAKAALADLLAGRWPRIIGFSWWNADFFNDIVTGKRSNMRVQDSRALRVVLRHYIGDEPRVLSKPEFQPR
jgi:hypothetical protein